MSVIDEPLRKLSMEAQEVADLKLSHFESLVRLIDVHVENVLNESPATLIFQKNEHYLHDEDRERIRRDMRAYADRWIQRVHALMPQASRPEVSIVTQGVFSMLNTMPALRTSLPPEDVGRLMKAAALNALLGASPLEDVQRALTGCGLSRAPMQIAPNK